jgi:exodeoxyribonuclease VII large subunit
MAEPAPAQPTLWAQAPRILRVTDLNHRVRGLLDADPALADVWVEGEVSTPSIPPSGHCFFTLKDAGSQIRAVMFREELGRSAVRPQHGMAVICHGRVRAYEPQGTYQLYVESITPAGAGDLHARYEQLRAKLAAAGLFEAGRKRQLPSWPRRIGIVTSPMGAVWQDIRNVIRRRYPLVELILSPASVQGEAAAPSVATALQRLYRQPGIDAVIVARGGGSLEDLWAFNDERVVRTIVASPVPVISGVGHESDVTLADFAADVRAPTPSAAAELAVPDGTQLPAILGRLRDRASSAMAARVGERRRLVAAEARALNANAPDLAAARQRVADLIDRGHRALVTRTDRQRAALAAVRDALRTLGPHATLDRGYAIARLADGSIVRDATQTQPGEHLDVMVSRGSLGATVQSVNPETSADAP